MILRGVLYTEKAFQQFFGWTWRIIRMILRGMLYTEKAFQPDFGWTWRIIRMILRGMLYTEKAFQPPAGGWDGLFYLLQPSGEPGSVSNKKALALWRQGFFGVAEGEL